jgi:hypothetical protein
MKIADWQQVGLAGGEPVLRRRALALGTMAIATGNGRCPLPVLWVNFLMVSPRAAE